VLTCTFQAPVCSQNYYDWGRNNLGQVGNGSTSSSGVATPYLAASSVTQVSLGGSNSGNGQTVAFVNGSPQGWGDDTYGQLNDGGSTYVATPEPITEPSGVTWVSVSSSGGTVYWIDSNGGVWAEGDGSLGQMGDGTYSPSSEPVLILNGMGQVSGTSSNVGACMCATGGS
jgi:hypothetical protein